MLPASLALTSGVDYPVPLVSIILPLTEVLAPPHLPLRAGSEVAATSALGLSVKDSATARGEAVTVLLLCCRVDCNEG